MDDHIAKIYNDPAVAGETLFFTLLFVLLAYLFEDGVREGVQHAVTGAVAKDKVICKGNNFV